MPQNAAEYIRAVRDTLLAIHTGIHELDSTHPDGLPTSGSKAAIEQADPKWAEYTVHAWSLGIQFIESGAEHLTAFTKTITNPVETIACWTCVRSMLEPCALAGWLLNVAIDAKTRAGRTFGLRYDGLEQQIKYARAVKNSDAEIHYALDRIDKIEKEAIGLGFQRVTNKHGKRIGVGERVPTATDSIKTMLNMESGYKLLSAVAHAHSWAITQIGFKPAETENELAIGGVKIRALEKNLSMTGVVYLATMVAKSLTTAALHRYNYFGWDASGIVDLMNKSLKTLCLPPPA